MSKPFWASQTVWSSFAVIGASAGAAVLAWRSGDMGAFGAAVTSLLGGVNAIVGMFKLYILGTCIVALATAGAGLAYSCKSALDTAYSRGQENGRADVNMQVLRAIAAEQKAAAVLSYQASVKLTQIEQERIHVQHQLDQAVEAARHSASPDRSCLDARVLRALNRIGRSAGSGDTSAPAIVKIWGQDRSSLFDCAERQYIFKMKSRGLVSLVLIAGVVCVPWAAAADPVTIRLCRSGEALIYEVVLLHRDGRLLRVYVDAVTDDRDLNRQLCLALEQAGYALDKAFDGEEGHFLGETEPYDAVILDMGLPKRDGLAVLKAWRKAGKLMPVLILTARDRWSDKVEGFDAGADDYVPKPFHMEEVLARIRALLRRSAGHATDEFICGPLTLDARTSRVFVDGSSIKLTSHEYRLLAYLMHHMGRIVSRTELVEHLYDQDFDRDSNTIEVFVGRLRKKLGIDIIETIRGLGYVVQSQNHASSSVKAAEPAFWSSAILLIGAVILTTLYVRDSEVAFDRRLNIYVHALIADLASFDEESHSEIGQLGDPLFLIPFSGWYWQITRTDVPQGDVRGSRSLSASKLPKLAEASISGTVGALNKGYFIGPDMRHLRMVEQTVDTGDHGVYLVQVAGNAEELVTDTYQFELRLGLAFLLLISALVGSVAVQLRFALQPLRLLQDGVAKIRRGQAEKIEGIQSSDLAPLAAELNLLLLSNREIIERGRTHVGNLAHALKTPLSVIFNEVRADDSALAEKIEEQATIMKTQVDLYLERARAVTRASMLGTSTELKPVLQALVRTFSKIYRDKTFNLNEYVPDDLCFRGEKQDLDEILGNILDNAGKWAVRQIDIAVETEPADPVTGRRFLVIYIDDDGGGLSDEECLEATKRGKRLDETIPGSGLGLSIVADLTAAYGGAMILTRNPHRGLRVILRLPVF
eukprot:gene9564-9640_t